MPVTRRPQPRRRGSGLGGRGPDRANGPRHEGSGAPARRGTRPEAGRRSPAVSWRPSRKRRCRDFPRTAQLRVAEIPHPVRAGLTDRRGDGCTLVPPGPVDGLSCQRNGNPPRQWAPAVTMPPHPCASTDPNCCQCEDRVHRPRGEHLHLRRGRAASLHEPAADHALCRHAAPDQHDVGKRQTLDGHQQAMGDPGTHHDPPEPPVDRPGHHSPPVADSCGKPATPAAVPRYDTPRHRARPGKAPVRKWRPRCRVRAATSTRTYPPCHGRGCPQSARSSPGLRRASSSCADPAAPSVGADGRVAVARSSLTSIVLGPMSECSAAKPSSGHVCEHLRRPAVLPPLDEQTGDRPFQPRPLDPRRPR